MDIKAELISIGNELLSGRTLNTHGKDLGAALGAIGLRLMRDTTIPDDIAIIQSAITEASVRTGLIFVSGGLGPTVDDITRDAIGALLDQKIVLHGPTVESITRRYDARGRTMTPAAERQALVLEKAEVLPNSAGAAPGQRLVLPGGQTLFILPGPPHEFNAILNEEIIPWLQQQYSEARPDHVLGIWTKGIYESDIVTLFEKENFNPVDIGLGFYPGNGRVEIRLTASPDRQTEVAEAAQRLTELLSDYLDPEQ
jgi:nicotinamide-nucleotide amidase